MSQFVVVPTSWYQSMLKAPNQTLNVCYLFLYENMIAGSLRPSFALLTYFDLQFCISWQVLLTRDTRLTNGLKRVSYAHGKLQHNLDAVDEFKS